MDGPIDLDKLPSYGKLPPDLRRILREQLPRNLEAYRYLAKDDGPTPGVSPDATNATPHAHA